MRCLKTRSALWKFEVYSCKIVWNKLRRKDEALLPPYALLWRRESYRLYLRYGLVSFVRLIVRVYGSLYHILKAFFKSIIVYQYVRNRHNWNFALPCPYIFVIFWYKQKFANSCCAKLIIDHSKKWSLKKSRQPMHIVL